MIDIHSHILFGIDDGSKSLEESVEMLDAAKEAGFDKIIATPHVMRAGYDKLKAEKCMEILRPLAKERGIELYQGYEYNCYALSDDGIDRAVGFCTEGTKNILIEFKNGIGIPANWEGIVASFQHEGVNIVVAHPERYRQVRRNIMSLDKTIEMGCELQLDALSLEKNGLFDPVRKCAKKLLKKKMITYVATDAHSPDDYRRFKKLLKEFDSRILEIDGHSAYGCLYK